MSLCQSCQKRDKTCNKPTERWQCENYLHFHVTKESIDPFLKLFRSLYLEAIGRCTEARYQPEERGQEIIKSLCLLALGEQVHSLQLTVMQKQVFCQIKPSRWGYWEQYLVIIKNLLNEVDGDGTI